MKMWKFFKKKAIGDGAYQFETSCGDGASLS